MSRESILDLCLVIVSHVWHREVEPKKNLIELWKLRTCDQSREKRPEQKRGPEVCEVVSHGVSN